MSRKHLDNFDVVLNLWAVYLVGRARVPPHCQVDLCLDGLAPRPAPGVSGPGSRTTTHPQLVVSHSHPPAVVPSPSGMAFHLALHDITAQPRLRKFTLNGYITVLVIAFTLSPTCHLKHTPLILHHRLHSTVCHTIVCSHNVHSHGTL